MEIERLISFVQEKNPGKDFIPLHDPSYVDIPSEIYDVLSSGKVSTNGPMTQKFEEKLQDYLGAEAVLATNSGTSALHLALKLAGVGHGDLVITQSLAFVAVLNAIRYVGAQPLFVDVSAHSLSMDPVALETELADESMIKEGDQLMHRSTGKRIAACLVVNNLGLIGQLPELGEVCNKYRLTMIEDASQGFGGSLEGVNVGCFGDFGVYSFNGNKVITTGGGGALVCPNEETKQEALHISTQAKLHCSFEYEHDRLGYNYRMPSLNAALGVYALGKIESTLKAKLNLHKSYRDHLSSFSSIDLMENASGESNYWLNSVMCSSVQQRDNLLEKSNGAGVMTRPIWKPLHLQTAFTAYAKADLTQTENVWRRIVSLPSAVPS